MKKIYLNNLPKNGVTKEKEQIDWAKSVGYKVNFIYNDIQGEIEIVDYNITTSVLTIKYNNNISTMYRSNFKKCSLGRLVGEISNEFKAEIGQKFKDTKRDITITDREYRKNKKGIIWKWYKYTCNKCGWTEGWSTESNLIVKNYGCSCCCGKDKVLGINTIYDTDKWAVKYIGEEISKTNTRTSKKIVYPICPICGIRKNKGIPIYSIIRNKSIGCPCGDGNSYPNKLMYGLLKQLSLDFCSEYSPDWCVYMCNNKNKRGKYDFYFEICDDNKLSKYIIEMDGRWHTNDNKMTGQSKENSLFIDNSKDKLARDNNIKIIRIDCEKSDLEYIKLNIIKSELKNIVDLSLINWDKCEEFALSNLVKIACENKKNNPNLTSMEIGKLMNLNYASIINYLKKGAKLGWCSYNAKDEMRKNSKKNGESNCKQTAIYKDNILLGIFKSASDLANRSKELFGIKLYLTHISSVCLGNILQYNGFTFKYI